jgi:hypothetical protein
MELTSSNPNALQTIQLRLKELASLQAKAGWFPTAKYPDGTYVAEVAAQNEFGNPTKKIPPRPTVRPAATENQKAWEAIAAQGANRVLVGKATARDVMELLGEAAESAIRKNIAALTSPKLAEYTLAKRRERGNSSEKPLVDTRLEFNTVTSVVEDATT